MAKFVSVQKKDGNVTNLNLDYVRKFGKSCYDNEAFYYADVEGMTETLWLSPYGYEALAKATEEREHEGLIRILSAIYELLRARLH